jgi:uncharacterized peroxidase-related enzyme
VSLPEPYRGVERKGRSNRPLGDFIHDAKAVGSPDKTETRTRAQDVAKKAKHSIGLVGVPARSAKARVPTRASRRPVSTARPSAAKPALARAPAFPAPAPLPRQDDGTITALKLPAGQLSPAMRAYFEKCQEKLGFIPNVLAAYAFDNAKLEAFAAMYNDLMLAPSGLSKLEREMIAVAVSSQNRCYYCLVAHGAAVRVYSGDPALGELVAMNYRAARLSKRQRAMLDFAVKMTNQSWAIEEADRERLRRAGFTDRDIWDIAAVAGFFNMSNRVASATDMRPNAEYHSQGR